jgi:hypothetical protein
MLYDAYFMRIAVKVLNSIAMEYTEWESRFRINFLRILHHMCLFLYPLKLPKEKFLCVNNIIRVSFFHVLFILVFNQIMINGVINGEPFNGVDVLNQFEAHGASNSSVPELVG